MNKPLLPLQIRRRESIDWPFTEIENAKGRLLENGEIDWVKSATENHDRLTEENAKLRELLSDVMECVNQDLWDTRCDDAKQLLTELKDQSNDK